MYRVKKHSPINTALAKMNNTDTPSTGRRVTGCAGSMACPVADASGGFRRRSARNKQYSANSSSKVKRLVGSPEMLYPHSVSENNNSSPAITATRWSNNCFAQAYTSSSVSSRHNWLNGTIAQRSGV